MDHVEGDLDAAGLPVGLPHLEGRAPGGAVDGDEVVEEIQGHATKMERSAARSKPRMTA